MDAAIRPIRTRGTTMNEITVDADLAAKLVDATQPVEFRDEQGRLLGVFKSEAYWREFEKAVAACPVTEEELDRRSARKGGRTLKEIMDDLNRQAPP
jgi:hypothetical protein